MSMQPRFRHQNACPTCGVHGGYQCVSLTRGKPTDTHQARLQSDPMRAPLAERVVTVKGIELPYARRRYNSHSGVPLRRDTVETGTAFVPAHLLEELLEADNSWGCGGGFLIGDPTVEAALECAGLITPETRGGVHTDEAQRIKIRALLDRVYPS